MKYKTIIISTAALFLVGVFFGYRYIRQRTGYQEHIENTYRRMTDMAKTSAMSGLPQMARALNRYYADHNVYPPHLKDLYPYYIQSRSFISDISWQYLPRRDNFMLVKSVTRDNRVLVATIDKNMRPKTPHSIIAKALPPQTPTALVKNAVEASPDNAPVKIPFSNNGVPRVTKNAPAVLPSKVKEIPLVDSEQKVESLPKKGTGRVSQKHPLDADDVSYDQLVALSKNYFVWRDKNGRLGFSNVQYPDKQEMALIFINGEWQEFQEQ